ncbi:MAG: hypothetical protein ACRD5G_09070 [Candidatus Acidiferrales bacterium]
MIYVVEAQPAADRHVFYVVPRWRLAKDSGSSPNQGWIAQFREAWHLLAANSPVRHEKPVQILSKKMRDVLNLASKSGLKVELVRLKKKRHWPEFNQNQILVEGKRCQVFSATRLDNQRDGAKHNYVALRSPKSGAAAEFLLYVFDDGETEVSEVYVIPRNRITCGTTLSVSNSRLLLYRNRWGLLKGDRDLGSFVAQAFKKRRFCRSESSARRMGGGAYHGRTV